MQRPLPFAFAVSALLHGVVLAFVLLPARSEPPVVAFDVVWLPDRAPASASPEDGSANPDMAAAPPSDGAAETRIAVPVSEPEAPRVSAPVISPTRIVEPPTDERVTRTTEHRARHETIETAASPRRRQAVATRPAESRRSESIRMPALPLTADPAADTALSAEPVREAGAGSAMRGGTAARTADAASAEDGAQIVHRVSPTYPPAARRRGIEGSVLLQVHFDGAGLPREISVLTSSGSALLDDAARDAVAHWRFRTGSAGAIELPLTFRLAGEASIAHQGVLQ